MGSRGVTRSGATEELDVSARLAVNAWAERSRDPELGSLLAANYTAIGDHLVALVRRWMDAGVIVTCLPPDEVAGLIQQTAFGAVAQQAILGTVDLGAAAKRLEALLEGPAGTAPR